MAAARFSSAISSMLLISRASSMVCWPSAILRPAFCSSNSIGGSMMSTPTGMLPTPASRISEAISSACRSIRPKDGDDGAAQAEQARLAVFRLEPRRIEPVVHGGRAEVPQDRIGAAARQQRPAADLVALPLADLGGGEIADVVDVHHQQRAEVGLLQRLPGARPAGSGAGGGSRRAPRNRRPWCRAPAARGPSCSAGRCPRRGWSWVARVFRACLPP